MHSLFKKIIPFIFFGIMIVALIGGLILLSYLLILGAAVGLGLFAIAWIKDRFFPSKDVAVSKQSKHQGRTFEHDNHK